MSEKKTENELPPCGLYRTGREHNDDDVHIHAGALVMFHNHSNRNMPFVQFPEENVNNRWSFSETGPGIENDQAFLDALEPLRDQGVYFLNEHIHTPDGVYPEFTMVQLGYNRDGNPILFPAKKLPHGQNGHYFEDAGYMFEDLDILKLLSPETPIDHTHHEDDEPEDESALLN